jgi:hypothetical protein
MAAGLGFKTFATGDVLSAADTNGYLMQGVLVFASATARDSSITSPQEGQFAYLKDTNVTTYYTGSAWANLDTTGMTNPMTTTGDTIYSSSGSTPARLGIGSAGQVLTVASGVPSWATPAGGSSTFVGCAVFTTSNQSIPNSTYTAINFNSESIDTDAFHSTTTNTSRITIPSGKAGKYSIAFNVMYDPSVTGSRSINVYKNGATLMGSGEVQGSAGSYVYNSGFFIAELAVADYLEFMIYQTSGGALTVFCRDREKPFQVQYLGA